MTLLLLMNSNYSPLPQSVTELFTYLHFNFQSSQVEGEPHRSDLVCWSFLSTGVKTIHK